MPRLGTGYNYGSGSILGLGTSTCHGCGQKKSFLPISCPIIIQNKDPDYNGSLNHSYLAYTFSLRALLLILFPPLWHFAASPPSLSAMSSSKRTLSTQAHSNHHTGSLFLVSFTIPLASLPIPDLLRSRITITLATSI